MQINCPHCSAQTEYIEGDCEICPECGKELLLSTTSQTAEPENAAADQASSGIDFGAIFKKIISGTSGKEKAEEIIPENRFSAQSASMTDGNCNDLSARSKAIADSIEDWDFDRPLGNDCPYVKIEYNRNLFFVTGSESVIKLRVTPLCDHLKTLFVYMESERAGSIARRQIPVQEILRKDRSFLLIVPFSPGSTPGRLSFSFYIGCQAKGNFSYYQFKTEHTVYDSTQSGNAICSQITINQDISSYGAADVNYRGDSIGDALKKLADKNVTVNELIDRLHNLPADYRLQYLSPSRWRPEEALVKGLLYSTRELIITWNGKTIYLVNRPEVVFGRDKQSNLIVRSGKGILTPQDYPNSTVSRKHASILYEQNTVKLFDFSTYGTYINGRRPTDSGIQLDDRATIEFGDIHWNMEIQKCRGRLPHNICQSCSADKIKSITFTRQDDEPEYYLLVWQCCELGRIIPELSDWTVFSRNECFFIRTPEQDFHHLRPGKKIESGNNSIEVTYFKQD